MAAFESTDGLDWVLLRNGPITVFDDSGEFIDTMLLLADSGYQVTSFDGTRWTTKAAMLADIATSFGFPEHFGANLDALADCLADVAVYAYGADPAATGSAVAIDRIDVLAAAEPRTAQALLDILADTSRRAMLHGHRFSVIASTADPGIRFDPVGATPVTVR